MASSFKSLQKGYLREGNFFEPFTADQCVIIKKNYFKHTYGLEHEDAEEHTPPVPVDWYPYANSYYPFAEDVDPVERVNHLLVDKPSYVSLNSFYADSELKEPVGTTKNAQQKYLESDPVSFIILGKPGIGQENLGKQLAEHWRCVYIEPSTLIEEEILSGSRAGQCIEFNLRCGRAIGIDVILRLVEKRINSDTAKHRGFVICGLPLIPNKLYKDDPISSESAVFTVKDIFEEVLDTTIEIGIYPERQPQPSETSKFSPRGMKGEGEEDEEIERKELVGEDVRGEETPSPFSPQIQREPSLPLDVGPDFNICQPAEISTNYEDQINFLFNLLKPPFLIIYVMCNAKDVIKKRENEKFDVHSNLTMDLLLESTNKKIYKYFTHKRNRENEFPEDVYETFIYDNDIDSTNLKHLVTLPKNFPINVESQLDVYHYTAMNFIERRIMTHDPQYFLKLDGRTSIRRMFHILKSRLNILPLQKVLVPERLLIDTLPGAEDVSPPTGTNLANYENLSFEDHFLTYRTIGIPGLAFKWTWSDWMTKCPVALKNGILKNGDKNYAVQFLNKIFYLSDEESFIKFYRNPRPYLLEPYPRPTCKIFIFGPKCSGKTAIANCLGYLLNGTVLSTASIVENFIEHKYQEFIEHVRQLALVEGLNLLKEMRAKEAEAAEIERTEKIKNWVESVKQLVDEYVKLLHALEIEEETTKLELSSFAMAMVKHDIAEIETETTLALKHVREHLAQLNIPEDMASSYQSLVQDKQKLLTYLPDNLKKKYVIKPATVHDDFVVQYVNEAVANAVFESEQVSNQNIVEVIQNAIMEVEDRYVEEGGHRGGWIIDGMLCDVAVFQELYPHYIADDIIVLKDTEDFEFLRDRFKTRGANVFRQYRDFFMSVGKVDAAWRAPSQVISTVSYKETLGRSILSDIFDDSQLGGISNAGNLIRDENYYEDLLKHKMKWITAEEYFQSFSKPLIEIQVTNKSLPELMSEAIRRLEDQYRVHPSVFSEKDQAEEIAMFATDIVPEEGAEETAVVKGQTDSFLESNRRYGSTSYYCPVMYHDNWILWKGHEKFAVKFEDQIYLLSSEDNMQKFLVSPREYLTKTFSKKLPPPRICVVGLPDTGKTKLSQALSFNYGLPYISFENIVKQYFRIKQDSTFEDWKRSTTIPNSLSGYLNGSSLLPEDLYTSEIHPLWFTYPVRELGFVLDDFPKRPTDVDMMIQFNLVPDIIINLTTDDFALKIKMLERRLNEWQRRMLEEREKQDQTAREEWLKWERERERRFKEMMDEKREERYTKQRRLKVEDLEETEKDNVSQVSVDSVAEQRDADEINRILDLEMPMVAPPLPEDFETTKLLFEGQISEHVASEKNFVQAVQAVCERELLPYTSITIDLENHERNERSIYYNTEHIKFRNDSLFERCYEVSMEVADRLLTTGYCLLSKFGKLCPVQYSENKNPFHMFQILEQKNNVFPLIHGSYIYYLIGRTNVDKFKKEPLKYIDVAAVNFPLVPFRMAISGPPKCGKTTLANRIRMEYGLKIITRGQAIRFVLAFLPFSSLAMNLESVLRKGWEATDEMVARCVEAASIDPWAVSQGVIFDGFPDTISEVRHLSYLGLIPQLVIDLQATKRQVFECLENDVGRRGFPKYSLRFVKHLYQEYREVAETFKPWFDREYQSVYKISIDRNNWSLWYQSEKVMTAVFFEIKHYYIHCHNDWPLRLANMQVTPLEFLERQSSYKTFCPCCLHFSNMLTSGGEVPDRTGLVQWRHYYYWLCPQHIERFLKTPEIFLPPYGANKLPPHLPTFLNLKVYPQNVYEDGACIVCYKTKTIINKGILKYAIDYNYKTYLFDTLDCLKEFMQRPSQYSFTIKFKPPGNYPSLDYHELPILGMLEQYVAADLIKAVKYISRRRPVIPGLSVATSAAVGIGLFLKVFNNLIPPDYKVRYMQGDELFHVRREQLIQFLDRMKHVINPYLHYEEPLPEFKMLESIKSSSSAPSTIMEVDISEHKHY
uniref:Adenylate kinase 9-like n=1 Tax=Diabrotica virgifera virgifera TaxID=50390 RepID=A0A6P7FKY8_DIAVI